MIAFIARSSGRGSTQRLRVDRFAERGRLRRAAEDDGSGLPLHGQRLDRHTRRRQSRLGRDTPSGWNCYITNIVKSVARPAKWNAADWEEWFIVAEAWAPVLAWELEHGTPLVLAAQGARTKKVLDHLVEQRLLPQRPELLGLGLRSGPSGR